MRMMIAVISSRVSNWQQSSRKMNNKKSRKHWKKRKGMKIRKFKTLAIAAVLLSAFAFLNFSDESTSGYQMMNEKVIKRVSDGALYLKGVINIKFKGDINSASSTKTGVANIDGILSNYSVKKVEKSFPLNRDLSKRKIGDEQLARIYQISYDATIDPF